MTSFRNPPQLLLLVQRSNPLKEFYLILFILLCVINCYSVCMDEYQETLFAIFYVFFTLN